MVNKTSAFPSVNNTKTTTLLNTKQQLALTTPKKINKNSFKLASSLRRFGKQSLPLTQRSDTWRKRLQNTQANPNKQSFLSYDHDLSILLLDAVRATMKKPEIKTIKTVKSPELQKRKTYTTHDTEEDIPVKSNTW